MCVDNITVVLNKWPSVDVLYASSNGGEFLSFSVLQLGLVGLRLRSGLVSGLEL